MKRRGRAETENVAAVAPHRRRVSRQPARGGSSDPEFTKLLACRAGGEGLQLGSGAERLNDMIHVFDDARSRRVIEYPYPRTGGRHAG